MKRLNLEQGSPEWHAWRTCVIGSSDAASIAGIGFMTPYQCYQNKLGLYEVEDNYAMSEGRRLEPLARDKFFELTGIRVNPACIQSYAYPFMGASLDGICDENSTMIEIKTGSLDNLEKAKRGEIPERYYCQMQHQLAVTGLDSMIYCFYDGKDLFMVPVKREQAYIDDLIKMQKEFWDNYINFIAPPLTEKDYVVRSGAFAQVAENLNSALEEQKRIELVIESLRAELILLAEDKNSVGGGIKLSKIPRQGNIDYSKIEVLKTMDLEPYRKPTSITWRVTKEKTLN